MPSKPLMILIVLLVVGGAIAFSNVDTTRDVPRFPAELGQFLGTGTAPGAGASATAPEGKTSGAAKVPAGTKVEGKPAPAAKPGDICMVRTVDLVKLPETDVVAVRDGPGMAAVIIDKSGKLQWSSLDAGGYDAVANLMKQNAETKGFTVYVTPDKKTPWKYVAWAFEVARMEGIENVYLGVTASSLPKAGLGKLNMRVRFGPPAMKNARTVTSPDGKQVTKSTPDMPSGMSMIPVEVSRAANGEPSYKVAGTKVREIPGLLTLVLQWNEDCGSLYGGNYSKVPEKTPWELKVAGDIPAAEAIKIASQLQEAGVGSMRIVGDYGPVPGLAKKK